MTQDATPIEILSTRLCPWLAPSLARLDAARAAGRLGHAWLLVGPAGVGKINLALALARRLLRPSGPLPSSDLGPDEAVAAMQARHVPADRHPDLHWVFPEEDKRTIAIEQVRDVADALTLKAHGGGAKVVIVEPADAMTTAAANALLKTLEEPAADTYLLLLSHQPGRLPATIRSRCQRLSLARPPLEAVARWQGTEPGRIAAAWWLAGGSPLRCAEMVASGEINKNRDIVDTLAGVCADKSDPQTVAEAWIKDDPERVLNVLTRYLHREARARVAPDVSTSVTDRDAVTLHNVWVDLTLRRLLEQHAAAEKLLGQIGSGINAELSMQALLLGFQGSRGTP
jgi:DNA polymerase-3 subunit delta'